MACPDDSVFVRRQLGQLPTAEEAALDRHIDTCSRCFALGLELARAGTLGQADRPDSDVSAAANPDIESGAPRIGRFAILRVLGAGAMGTVYAAFDEQLERRIAVKLLRRYASDAARARVVREARAMAKLTHPNVVQVFEIVECPNDRLAIAMEFVRGPTLAGWQSEEGRTWREILGAYRQAGAGLATAHAAGVVHRDFKPHNAMVADAPATLAGAPRSAGTVKVGDFGLARLAPDVDQDGHGAHDTHDDQEPSGADARLTATGGLVGTPAYMAPEQFERADVDATADQFAFCVSLWEALFGAKPFTGDTPAALVHAIVSGPRPVIPEGTAVPRFVSAALRRGLAAAPDHRWPSMQELLEALAPAPRSGARGWRLGAAAVLASAAVGFGAWWSARPIPCTGAEGHLAGVWDSDQRARVETAMLATEVPAAPHAWTHVASELDAYAAEWLDMHTDTCEATAVRREQSVALMDLRMACLQRAKVGLQAATNVLAAADADIVHRAQDLVGGLSPLPRCADIEALEADVRPPNAAEVEAVARVRTILAGARAERLAGRLQVALAKIEEAKQAAVDVTYDPVQTELALQEGRMLVELENTGGARRALERAVELGSRGKQWDEVRMAAQDLLISLAYFEAKPEQGLEHLALLRGLTQLGTSAEADLHRTLGLVQSRQGNYGAAETEYRRALEINNALGRNDHTTRNNLAISLERQGRLAEAAAEQRRALIEKESMLGRNHPDVADAHSNLAAIARGLGRYAEAEAEIRSAIEISRGVLGAKHPRVAVLRGNLATVLYYGGDSAQGEIEARHAVRDLEAAFGADHLRLANSRQTLAAILADQGKLAEAMAEYRRLAASMERTLGPDHPDMGPLHAGLGFVAFQQGEFEEAESEYTKALAIQHTAHGTHHPLVVSTRASLAEVLLAQHRNDEAAAMAESAWAGVRTNLHPSLEHADAAYVLARALWPNPASRDRALELAHTAQATYRDIGPGWADDLHEVEAWIAEHSP